MISDEQLRILEERYLPAGEQKCRVCGSPMKFASSGDRGEPAQYTCSSDAATREFPGNSLRDKLAHWTASRWYDRRQADPLVIELVRKYRDEENGNQDAPGEEPVDSPS